MMPTTRRPGFIQPLPTFMRSTMNLPQGIPGDPHFWTRENVHNWLKWCGKEFSLDDLEQVGKLSMNGKALMLLSKDDFKVRFPCNGDVLYNAFQDICTKVNSMPRMSENAYRNFGHHLQTWGIGNGIIDHLSPLLKQEDNERRMPEIIVNEDSGHSSPNSSPELVESVTVQNNVAQPLPLIHASGSDYQNRFYLNNRTVENMSLPMMPSVELNTNQSYHTLVNESAIKQETSPKYLGSENLDDGCNSGRLLWDFLLQVLKLPERYGNCIRWENEDQQIFKIVDTDAIAKLWGKHKNTPNMNFDKMSRALRYYYNVNILEREQGTKRCYRFLKKPDELRNTKQKQLKKTPVISETDKQLLTKPAEKPLTSHSHSATLVNDDRENPSISQAQALNLKVIKPPK